jgi:hypothetical protein
VTAGAVVGSGPIRQSQRFDVAVRDIDPEAVDPAIEPEPHDVAEVLGNVGVTPVEVGLCGVERVQVPLARLPVGFDDARPRRSAEHAQPVVGRELAVGPGAGGEVEASTLSAARPRPQGR